MKPSTSSKLPLASLITRRSPSPSYPSSCRPSPAACPKPTFRLLNLNLPHALNQYREARQIKRRRTRDNAPPKRHFIRVLPSNDLTAIVGHLGTTKEATSSIIVATPPTSPYPGPSQPSPSPPLTFPRMPTRFGNHSFLSTILEEDEEDEEDEDIFFSIASEEASEAASEDEDVFLPLLLKKIPSTPSP